MRDIVIKQNDRDPKRDKNVIFVPGRARNSAELEEWERRGQAHAQTLGGKLPIPFYDGDKLEPLSENDKAILADLGVTEDEWREIIKRD